MFSCTGVEKELDDCNEHVDDNDRVGDGCKVGEGVKGGAIDSEAFRLET